jgi:hypothetical protein
VAGEQQLVQVAVVKAADETSGLRPQSLSIRVASNEQLSPQDVVVKDGRYCWRIIAAVGDVLRVDFERSSIRGSQRLIDRG